MGKVKITGGFAALGLGAALIVGGIQLDTENVRKLREHEKSSELREITKKEAAMRFDASHLRDAINAHLQYIKQTNLVDVDYFVERHKYLTNEAAILEKEKSALLKDNPSMAKDYRSTQSFYTVGGLLVGLCAAAIGLRMFIED